MKAIKLKSPCKRKPVVLAITAEPKDYTDYSECEFCGISGLLVDIVTCCYEHEWLTCENCYEAQCDAY